MRVEPINAPLEPLFEEFFKGTEGRKASTTMVFVRMLSKLLRDKEIGDLVVPIVPDEARTFGMESLFRAVGIYSHVGQKYEPVDMDTLLYYKEAKDGQILEEGITEAGSMSSFIAAGTAYSTYGVNTIPFFIFYSMFGFQRVADLIWAGADSRMRGFLLGATAGRTTLAGEGLQHQDGQSHVYSLANAELRLLRPGVCLRAGGHHPGRHPPDVQGAGEHLLLPDGDERTVRDAGDAGRRRDGIVKGMYRFSQVVERQGEAQGAAARAAGRSSTRSIAGAKLLEKYGVAADVWSVTSYNELYRDAHACDRWNMLHPGEKPKVPYVTQCLGDTQGVIVAASDYLKVLPASIDRWMPRRVRSLGTDGFGRSEDRKHLREFFEVDARFVALATLDRARGKRRDRREGRVAGDQGLRYRSREEESGEDLSTGDRGSGDDRIVDWILANSCANLISM